MQNIQQLIEQISLNPDCKIYPPDFSIELPENTPSDLQEFYQLTNGVDLFKGADYAISIVGRQDFVKINPFLYPKEDIIWEELPDDISNEWYLIGDDKGGSQYISIDLNPKRLGKCYDSFWDIHATVGDSPVIAKSFTELLERLFNAKGQDLFWLEDNFISYGDAYDNI